MAEQFLSCDGNFIQVPKDNFPKKKDPPAMLSISTISASLSTDDAALLRRRTTEPKLCCCLPVNAVSIFAVTFTCILILSAYIFLIVRVVQHTDPQLHKEKVIVLLSIATCLILIFGSLFVWGIFGKRPGFLLPHIALTAFLLFALAGISIFLFLTAPDEVRSESGKEGSHGRIVNLVLFRVILVGLALLQAFFLYVFIRSYLYMRRLVRDK